MRLTAVVSALLISAAAGAGAQGPPSTDIYLAPLSMHAGRPVIGTPVNVTNRPGYDNQPSFTPTGRSILYTSVREDGQSDIYRYDIPTKRTSRVTTTPESEYSATVMPGGKRFSVIRVEADSTQRLWSFALDGSDPKLVLTAIRPVGYHAWLDKDNLALFVLGRPNALVHSNARTDKSDTLARNIGRSLLPLPDKSGFSYVRNADSTSTLAIMRWPGRASHDLIALPRGSQDVAWVGKGAVVTASGSKLLFWRNGEAAWSEAGDLAGAGVKGISRLAVSPDGRWIAIVANAP
jgi:dipeptidyl aminopeptidase/acylaminoacyl peptidase